MEDKAESLRKRLASIKNNSETPEEANETKKQIAQAKFVFSPFISAGIFWLCLEQLNAKFPNQFIHFGYWELFLYTVSLMTFLSIFKSSIK